MFLNIIVTAIIVLIGLLYNRKKSIKTWLLILSLIIVGNIVTYYARRHLRNKTKAITSNTHLITRNAFLDSLKENKEVIRATYTEQGYLAITVKNDGEDKTELATYFCDLAKSENIFVGGVVILDAADTKFGKSYAYGTQLGEAICF